MKINVKLINRDGAAVLLQWLGNDGSLNRGIIPANLIESVDDGYLADDSDLDAAIPYGDPLTEILPDYGPLYTKILIDELHRRNIWKASDVLTNHEAVRASLLKAFDLSGILRRAREYRRDK